MNTRNVLDVLITAYLVNSESLLTASATFIEAKKGQIARTDAWEKIKYLYPNLAFKLSKI